MLKALAFRLLVSLKVHNFQAIGFKLTQHAPPLRIGAWETIAGAVTTVYQDVAIRFDKNLDIRNEVTVEVGGLPGVSSRPVVGRCKLDPGA